MHCANLEHRKKRKSGNIEDFSARNLDLASSVLNIEMVAVKLTNMKTLVISMCGWHKKLFYNMIKPKLIIKKIWSLKV